MSPETKSALKYYIGFTGIYIAAVYYFLTGLE